ncbi:hypothetical protein BH18ACT2_BH18ACT2_20030 [soil metagenome]
MAVTPKPVAVVDLDGVVADVRHRLRHLEPRPGRRARKDWRAFFAAAGDDDVHPEGLAIVQKLAADHDVVFVTGRPSHVRNVTETWLDEHGLGRHELIMRPDGDHRPAPVVKVELLAAIAAERPIAVVVDDDRRVLEAVAAAGHPTFLADWERRPQSADAALHQAQDVEGRT